MSCLILLSSTTPSHLLRSDMVLSGLDLPLLICYQRVHDRPAYKLSGGDIYSTELTLPS